MKRQFKNLIIVAASLATVVSSVTPAAACGGRGGGYGYARQRVYRPAYTPSYSTYQPQISQPRVYNQPQYGFNPSASVINQPQQVQQIAQRPQPVAQQASFQQQQVQRAAVQQASARTQAPVANTPRSAASNARTQAPVANTPTSAASNARAQAPAAKSANAESSALQMLQSLGNQQPQQQAQTTSSTSSSIPQFSAAPASNDQAHVGTWQVTLPNSQSVELALAADGKFVWTAVNKGNRKSFNGQYRLDGARLTLVRSNDLQQMSGSWKGNAREFTFKLDGANNGGLNFKRA